MGNILKVNIRTITREEPKDFYRLLGPFLSRREIVEETGFPIWDDDGKTWLLAIVWENGKSKVAGFCAVRPTNGHQAFTSAYVRPEYRRRRVYEQLWAAREAVLPRPCAVRSMVTKAALGTFKRHGFKAARKTKQYTQMTKHYV